MPIKSFRGQIIDGGQDKITLHTNNGSVGYRINKISIIPNDPTKNGNSENVLQIWKVEQSTPSATAVDINFNDQTLLGVAMWVGSDGPSYQFSEQIIFDRDIFNQDIYLTHTNTDGSKPANYYIELEQIKLDLNENTVATLKDIRNIESQ